jgi:hypothetical protein
MPATFALTGSPVAAKVSSWLPLASMAYVAYSTARNPLATVRAARAVIRGTTRAQGERPAGVALSLTEGQVHDLAGELATRLGRLGDWYLALLLAAADETGGDARRALELADAAYARRPHAPAGGPGAPNE